MFTDLIINIFKDKPRYSRELVLVVVLNDSVSKKISDSEVYISEYVVAKILGFLPHLQGHVEVSKEFFLKIPELLNEPTCVLKKKDRKNEVYLICGDPAHRIVLEIKRQNNKTEINTIHRIRKTTLEKLKQKCIEI